MGYPTKMDYKKIEQLTHKMRQGVELANRYETKGEDVPWGLQAYIIDLGYWICTYATIDTGGIFG
jgi:hypothetical protein